MARRPKKKAEAEAEATYWRTWKANSRKVCICGCGKEFDVYRYDPDRRLTWQGFRCLASFECSEWGQTAINNQLHRATGDEEDGLSAKQE
jgi:hypothetical protein